MDSLLNALHVDADKLRSVEFIADGKPHTIYYKLLTGLGIDKIRTLSKRTKITEGKEVEYIDENLMMVHTIIAQSLDKDANRVFGITDEDKIKKIPYETQCYLSAVMGLKSISDIMEEHKEALKKIQNQEP